MPKIPTPLAVDYALKPLASASTTIERLSDGRTRYAIEHELLRGVTPAMIVWFLNHMTDVIELAGERVQRYRAWHPRDHIQLTYLRPADDGSNCGAGSQLRIEEAFGGDPKMAINVVATVDFLDETGFAHYEVQAGLRVARMDYSFEQTPEGTLYRNALTVGRAGSGPLSWFINRVVQPLVFPHAKGMAWIQHNVEEVGTFEAFLPQMYERHNSDHQADERSGRG